MSDVIHLTAGAFPKVASQSAPVLIDFWAPWCGPCRMQGPILEDVARAIGDKAVIAKVNVDEEPALAARFGVQSIPTVLGFQNGRLVERWMGARSRPDMEMLIRRALLGKATTIRFADR